MYIQISQNTVVREESVIGFFDMDNTTASHLTRAFLFGAQREGIVEDSAEDLPGSFVLCCEDGKNRIYLSPHSTATLAKRALSKQL